MEACSSCCPALLNLRMRWRGHRFLVAPLGCGVRERAIQEGAGKGAERLACRAPSPELYCPELRLKRGAPSLQTFLGTAPPLVPVFGLRVGARFWIVFSDLPLKVTRTEWTHLPTPRFPEFFFALFCFLGL